MSDKDFIIKKLNLIQKDRQPVFDKLVEPLTQMAEQGVQGKKIKITADGNWFNVSFDAVEAKKDRLVISAKRLQDGLMASRHDPAEKEYVVNFQGTRAAYLRGYYKPYHPVFRWPYIWWDIRSYANQPGNAQARVYVQGFYAHDEIRKLVIAMEGVYGTSNILNKYINDNLLRFQAGIKAGKAPVEIEKAWSRGLMESLGYQHVEAFDTGLVKSKWNEVHVHWCKNANDLRKLYAR